MQTGDNVTVTIDNTLKDKAGNQLAAPVSVQFAYAGEDIGRGGEAPEVLNIVYKKTNEFNIVFSKRIAAGTVASNIQLRKEDGSSSVVIAGTVSLDADRKTATVTPDESLIMGEEYSILVSTLLTDDSGLAINEFLHRFVVMNEDMFIYEKGNENLHTKSRIGNNHLFHGRTYEPENGLYYYRHRYYLHRIGRFLQTDPMGYKDSMNPYQAFNMNPANFTDPMGLFSKDAGKKALLVAEGATNAAIQIPLWFGKLHLLVPRLIFGYDFNASVNYTGDGSIVDAQFGKQERGDILKDASMVYPMADFVTQVGKDAYFGYIFRGGDNMYGESSRDNMWRHAGSGLVMAATAKAMKAGMSSVAGEIAGNTSKISGLASELDNLSFSLRQITQRRLAGRLPNNRLNRLTTNPALKRSSGPRNFKQKYPQYADGYEIHHSIEWNVLDRYPGTYTPIELNLIKFMRPIKKGQLFNKKPLHRSIIRKSWDRFQAQFQQRFNAGEISVETMRQLIERHAGYIDRIYLGL